MKGQSKVDAWLKGLFGSFGRYVALHKTWFLICPVVVSILLGIGMIRVEYSSDPDHLLTPVNGEGRQEKLIAEKFFPTNYSNFDASRSIKFGYYGYVMVTGLDGKSILDPEVWTEVRTIQEEILNLEVEFNNRRYMYKDICARWNNECYTNSLLSVADTFAVLSRGIFRKFFSSKFEHFSRFINLNFYQLLFYVKINQELFFRPCS